MLLNLIGLCLLPIALSSAKQRAGGGASSGFELRGRSQAGVSLSLS